jgi:hypothetical protein
MASAHAVVAVDEKTRYAHLLRPIRDLAESWSIDLAGELAEYLDELCAIEISLDGGLTTVNFAEAALVIQGSACVYSKKVEYLYSLVYQTLNRVSDKERAPQQLPAVDERGVDADAPRLGTSDEFLTLDDLPEASNLYLVEDEGQGDEATMTKSPLLILSAPAELGSDTGASMHASGVLMLDNWIHDADPASARMLSTMLDGLATARGQRLKQMGASGARAASSPSPAVAGQLTFEGPQFEGFAHGIGAGGDDLDDDDDGFGAAGGYDDAVCDEALGAPAGALDPAATVAPTDDLLAAFGSAHAQPGPTADRARPQPANAAALLAAAQAQGANTAWTPLDSNDPTGLADLRPFRKGKTWRLPPKGAGTLGALAAGLKRDAHGRALALPRAALGEANAPDGGDEMEACEFSQGASKQPPQEATLEQQKASVSRETDALLSDLALYASEASWALKGSNAMHEEFSTQSGSESKRRAAVRKQARDELARHTHVAPTAEAEADGDLCGGGERAAVEADEHEPLAPFDDDEGDDAFGAADGAAGFDTEQAADHEDEEQQRLAYHVCACTIRSLRVLACASCCAAPCALSLLSRCQPRPLLPHLPPTHAHAFPAACLMFSVDCAPPQVGEQQQHKRETQDGPSSRFQSSPLVRAAAPPQGPTLTGYERRYWHELSKLEDVQGEDGALHMRVSAWESRLLPLLEEQDKRRAFDLHQYGQELLARIPDGRPPHEEQEQRKMPRRAGDREQQACTVRFAELMVGQERFEACRLFLAALQLANNRNIDIVPGYARACYRAGTLPRGHALSLPARSPCAIRANPS